MSRTAIQVLSRDRKMARLVKAHDAAPIGSRPLLTAFVRAIVSQQLSTHAARAILERLETRVGIDAAKLARVRTATLQKVGLSRVKSACVQQVARLSVRGAFDDLSALDDDGVRDRLLTIRGVGPWTAQMVMIFALGRPDVWPVGDVGVQRAARDLYGVERQDLEEWGNRFRPYRSHAAWYLWRALESA